MARDIEITVKPTLAQFKSRLNATRSRLRKPGSAYRAAATFLDQWVQKNFRSEGAAVGGWAPLKPATKLARVRKNLRGGRVRRGQRNILANTGSIPISAGRMQTLQDTGRLRASMHPFATNKNAGIGSTLPYSKAHEEGLGPLPVRRILPKQPEVAPDLREIFRMYMAKAFRPLSGRRG